MVKRLGIDSSVYSIGIFLNSILGLVFYLFAARALGPTNFGVLAVVLSLATVSGDVFDFGINTAIITMLPSRSDPIEKSHLSSNLLGFKLVMISLVVVIGLLVSPALTATLLGASWSALPIFLGFACAAAIIFYGYVNSHLLAQKHFAASVVLNILANSLRLLGLFWLLAINHFDVVWAVVLFALPTAVVAVVWFLADRNLVKNPTLEKVAAKEIFHFSKWVAASLAVGSISARADNFLLTLLSGLTQTGIYTAVQRFFLAFNQIPAGIGTVLAPSFAQSEHGRRDIFLFGIATAIVFSIGLLGVAILSPWLVPLALGSKYLASVVPAQILALATIPFVFAVPVNSYILYARKNSKTVFWVTLVQLAVDLVGNLVLVPSFGAVGSAIAFGLGTVAALVLYALILVVYARH